MSGIIEGFQDILVLHTRSIIITIVTLCGALVAGILTHFTLYSTIRHMGKRRESVIYPSLNTRTKNAALASILLFAVTISLPIVESAVSKQVFGMVRDALAPIIIVCLSWLLIRFTDVLGDVVYARYTVLLDGTRSKSFNTQFQLLKRIIIFVIVIFAVGFVLMTFDKIRQLGATILASAGIAGIIVGMAAQRSVANLLAGIQIAVTESIRIGDSVVVEGEFGTVEEITLTYVVVKIWDNRRLVLPIMHFLEKPFQNWTREPSNLLGTVFLYVDHTVPVEEVRSELQRLLEESPIWDRAASGLHVTNITEKTVELRALVSASPPDLWDLRCSIREKLLIFLRTRYPESLPKVRADIRDFTVPSKPE